MKWCNYYGLIIMAVLMIPNTVYAIKCKNGFDGDYHNKSAEITEQISRYACFILMIFNIPYTWLGFWFSYGLIVYVVVNAVLVSAYCVIWIILCYKLRKKENPRNVRLLREARMSYRNIGRAGNIRINIHCGSLTNLFALC